MSTIPSELWLDDDLKNAYDAARKVLREANDYIEAIRGFLDSDGSRPFPSPYLFTVCNKARDLIRPVADELLQAHRALDVALPEINGVAAAFAHELVVEAGRNLFRAVTMDKSNGTETGQKQGRDRNRDGSSCCHRGWVGLGIVHAAYGENGRAALCATRQLEQYQSD